MTFDVSDETFEQDVLQRSLTVPVVVDLWAPWCQPCKTLGPILERVIGETNGRVVLVKVDVDQNPATSNAFQVQSIPAVYALFGGKVVDGFTGAQPEAQIREFVGKLLALTQAEAAGEVQALIDQGDEASLRRARELDPENREVVGVLARLLLTQGDAAAAVALMESVDPGEDIASLLEAARSELLPSGEQQEIIARLEALLGIVKGDDDARGEFVGLLERLAPGDPESAAAWRRKLSTALY